MKRVLQVSLIIAIIMALFFLAMILTQNKTEVATEAESTVTVAETTEESTCIETTKENAVETTVPETTTEEETTKRETTEEIVSEVLYGKWGNGSERKKKLEKAGYDYEEVQKKVTEKCPTTTAYVVAGNITSEKADTSGETTDGSKTFLGKMKITGYSAQSGFPVGQKTASGVGVNVGQCAMNRSQMYSLGITWGQKIYVEGFGTYTVTDCGCGWGVVDIYFLTNKECYAATSYRNVYIY